MALKTIPVTHIIAAVKDGLQSASILQETAKRTRLSVIVVLQRTQLSPSNIAPAERVALQILRGDDSIVTLPTDKSCSTVG